MELIKETYDYKDIKKIIGCGNERAYKIITECQRIFKEEFPNSIVVEKKVPKWFFNARVLGIEERSEKDDRKDM